MFDGHSKGTICVSAFLFLSSVIAILAATTLLLPDTFLDLIWSGKSEQLQQLSSQGLLFGILFILLTLILAVATYGWIKLYAWGWMLTSMVIGLNVLSDFGRAATGNFAEGSLGVVLGGLFLVYLSRPGVRARFRGYSKQTPR